MRELRLTLLSDGSSDRALLPLLVWLLRQHHVESAIQTAWADLRRLPRPPRGLPQRIQQALELYPCDLLFVHRDAERLAHSARIAEIQRGVELATKQGPLPSVVRVVPVRMQEAWLLFDEAVIRTAAGNPNGRQPLELPRLRGCLETPPMPQGGGASSGRRRHRCMLRWFRQTPHNPYLSDGCGPATRTCAPPPSAAAATRTLSGRAACSQSPTASHIGAPSTLPSPHR